MPDLLAVLREALADRYAVERELGRGGMATVFLAEDLKHHRSVAIKVLHAELTAALGTERFLREIETAARLQHPHILPLYDSGAATGFLYYVMPYVEGESLRDRLTREKQLPQEDALRIATEVAGALAYAHSHGVVHRDIKPENIMLSGGTAVVTDFGIARAVSAAGGGQHLTQTGTIIGTPAYMSPEQSTGSYEIDGRSDQYSLACVVYEMLVGEPPFTGPTAQAVIARHSLDMVSPPSIVRSTIPDAVEGAVLRALSKVPADRYATTALFAEALNTPSAATGAHRRATLERGVRRPRRGGRSGRQLRATQGEPARDARYPCREGGRVFARAVGRRGATAGGADGDEQRGGVGRGPAGRTGPKGRRGARRDGGRDGAALCAGRFAPRGGGGDGRGMGGAHRTAGARSVRSVENRAQSSRRRQGVASCLEARRARAAAQPGEPRCPGNPGQDPFRPLRARARAGRGRGRAPPRHGADRPRRRDPAQPQSSDRLDRAISPVLRRGRSRRRESRRSGRLRRRRVPRRCRWYPVPTLRHVIRPRAVPAGDRLVRQRASSVSERRAIRGVSAPPLVNESEGSGCRSGVAPRR